MTAGRAGTKPRPDRSARPWCVKHRRPMWREAGGRRHFCPPCRAEAAAARGAGRAWCVRCRLPLAVYGAGWLWCPACEVACHVTRPPRLARDPGRPACPSCGRLMWRERRSGRYFCRPCREERAAERAAGRPWCVRCRRPVMRRGACAVSCSGCGAAWQVPVVLTEAEAAGLLASVAARLPAYLTPDEREDAAQAALLDVLAGRVRPGRLTAKALKGYAARAVGMARDRFKFIVPDALVQNYAPSVQDFQLLHTSGRARSRPRCRRTGTVGTP